MRYAKLLVDRYRVKAKDVVILSQYRAQCAAIKEGLESEGHADISVSTVVKSQGKAHVRWCVWKGGGEDFPIGSNPRQLNSCVFQCDVPHQWIAQRQVGPVSVYCDGAGCHVLCLQHDIPV